MSRRYAALSHLPVLHPITPALAPACCTLHAARCKQCAAAVEQRMGGALCVRGDYIPQSQILGRHVRGKHAVGLTCMTQVLLLRPAMPAV